MSYFITSPIQGNIDKNSAVQKAPLDVANIAKSSGYQEIKINRTSENIAKPKLEVLVSTLLNDVKKNDTLFFQYATFYNTPEFNNTFIDAVAKIGAKKVVLIHELVELVHGYDKIWKDTADFLNMFEIVIVHTQQMADIIKPVIDAQVIVLELFDYLRPTEFFSHPQFTKIITTAGDISKSQELLDWKSKDVKLQMFGTDNDEKIDFINIKMVYRGVYDPEYLPSMINTGFGLIWFNDQENIKKDGQTYLLRKMETYSKISAPHRISLFISAGVPIIVKSNSALANFVEKNKIGFVVDSIDEAVKKVNQTTTEEYEELTENVYKVQGLVTNGFFTQRAFLKAIELLNIKGDF